MEHLLLLLLHQWVYVQERSILCFCYYTNFSLNMLDLGWLLVLHASECMCKHGASQTYNLFLLWIWLKEIITFAWGEGITDGCAANIVILEEETREDRTCSAGVEPMLQKCKRRLPQRFEFFYTKAIDTQERWWKDIDTEFQWNAKGAHIELVASPWTARQSFGIMWMRRTT